ncbi:hypothetical protein KJ885_04890 [Patescibacteria group bacterium]|nr:hypothetical protein [Patescibacteria group bacterium]
MEESKLLSLIPQIAEIAKKNKWQTHYNESSDAFYWTKKKLSKKVKLIQFIDEFSLYVNSSGKIEGLFLEYAKFNFVDHHKEFKPLFRAMTHRVSADVYTISKEKEDKVEHLLENIADKVAKETLRVVSKGANIESLLSA